MASLALLFSFLLYEAAAEPVVVQVKPGQDATLPCKTGDTSIKVAEWTRSDPEPSKDILFWRGGKTYGLTEGRVQLVDSRLKNGNVSLTLKNVSREDVGTYECRVVTAGSRRKKRANIHTEPISIIQLQVTDPEDQKGYIKDGHTEDTNNGNSTPHHVGLGAAAAVVVLVCLVSAAAAAVGLFLVRKSKRQRERKPELSAAEKTGDNLL